MERFKPTLMMEKALMDALRDRAEKEGRSLSNMVYKILRDALGVKK